MARRIAYAWSAGDKYYLSLVQAGNPDPDSYRPRNEYDSKQALLAEAAQRRLNVTWETGNGS